MVVYFMKMYLLNLKVGFCVVWVKFVEELMLGDVICYDFEGDGWFNYIMIVVVKDKGNMLFVNVQFYDSWMRYWLYEDFMVYMLLI